MRRSEYLSLVLTILVIHFVKAKNIVDCKLAASKLSSERDCTYKNAEFWNLSSTTIRATAPEGNLTQGEIVFETVLLSNGTRSLRFKEGFGVDILYALQLALGFNIHVITAKGWATQYSNKSWFGMAQQVIDDQADFAIAKTSILPNRAQDLAYLVPTHGLGLYAFFVQPKIERNIFLEPFSQSLWVTLSAIYIILIVAIRVISKLSEVTIGLQSEDIVLTDEVGIWGWHTVCQHGFHSPPKLICLRISILTGAILGLIIYVSYAAQLVSMFSFQTLPIKNIEDLLKSKINILVDGGNQRARNLIEGTIDRDPIAIKLATHMKFQKKTIASAGEGGGSVLKGNGSIISFKDSFYTTTKNSFGTLDDEFCQKVATVSVTGATFKSGLFVKKGSSLKEPFNIKMTTLINAGIMGRFVTKYEETYTPRCDGDKATATPVIAIMEVIFVFYGLGLGFLISMMLCLFEFVGSLASLNNAIVWGLALLRKKS